MNGTSPAEAAQTHSDSALAMYRALVGIGVICAVLIVGVHQWTAPVIAQNRAEALRAAILKVLPGAVSSAAFAAMPGGGFTPRTDKKVQADVVHAGYDAEGQLVGVAIEAQGVGYQDTVAILYGFDPHAQAIVGMNVLESRETPGLGDKIETDSQFLDNFVKLDVRLDASGARPLHAIESVKRGDKTSPWQIDVITGATISSQAITRILRDSSARWGPAIVPRVQELNAP